MKGLFLPSLPSFSPRSQTGQLHVSAPSGQQEVEKFEKFAEAEVAPAASLTQISLSET